MKNASVNARNSMNFRTADMILLLFNTRFTEYFNGECSMDWEQRMERKIHFTTVTAYKSFKSGVQSVWTYRKLGKSFSFLQ